MPEATQNNLEVFEKWLCRRILEISWVDKVTNEGVFESLGRKNRLDKDVYHGSKSRRTWFSKTTTELFRADP